MYHETWDLVVGTKFTSNQQRISAISSTIELAESACNGKLNIVSRDSVVNNKLLIAAIMIDETSEDIEMAINAINDGKHGIIHP